MYMRKSREIEVRERDKRNEDGRGGELSVNKRFCFFFNDTATTEIYTLSLHDDLPI
mgnify:CR=1 FL=1